jgi:hypothetical protein
MQLSEVTTILTVLECMGRDDDDDALESSISAEITHTGCVRNHTQRAWSCAACAGAGGGVTGGACRCGASRSEGVHSSGCTHWAPRVCECRPRSLLPTPQAPVRGGARQGAARQQPAGLLPAQAKASPRCKRARDHTSTRSRARDHTSTRPRAHTVDVWRASAHSCHRTTARTTAGRGTPQ